MTDFLIKNVVEPDPLKTLDDGIKDSIKNVEGLTNKVSDLNKELKDLDSDISFVDKKDLDSIEKFFKSIEQNKKVLEQQKKATNDLAQARKNLAQAEKIAIQIQRERIKNAAELEKVNQQAKKTGQESAKQKQQEVKIQQEQEKLTQQQIRTKRAETNEKKKAQAEAEKQAKALRDENSVYKQQTKLLADIKRELKDLQIKAELDIISDKEIGELKRLEDQFKKVDKAVRNAEQNVNEFGRSVGNYPQAIDQVSVSFKDLVSQLGPVALGIAAIDAAISGIGSAIGELQQINQEIGKTGTITGLTGQALESQVAGIRSVAETFDKDYNEVLVASNSLAKQFGISQEESLSLIQQGLVRGADAGGDFLGKVEEYPIQFKKAGLSAQEFVDVATQEAVGGLFGDKLLDTVKEAGLRIRELPKATEDAVKELFKGDEAGFKAFTEGVKSGAISTKDALITIKNQIEKTTPDVKTLQTLTADLLGGPGEDIGGAEEALKQFDAAINNSNKELTDFQKTQQQQLKTTKELQAAQVGLAKDVQPAIKAFQDFGKKALTFVINLFREILGFFNNLPQIIDDNIGKIALFGTALTAIFSAQIVSRVNKLSSSFLDLGKRILSSSIITKAAAAAQAAYSTVVEIVTGRTKIAAVAQKAFNLVLRANPIGLVITGLTALVGVMVYFSSTVKTAAKDVEKLNEANKKFADESNKRTSQAIKNISEQETKLKKLGATEQEIHDARVKNTTEAQKEFRRSIAVTIRNIEDLQAKQKELNKEYEEGRKSASSNPFSFASSVDSAVALGKISDSLKVEQERLKELQKQDNSLNADRIKALRDRENLEKEVAKTVIKNSEDDRKARRAVLIASINDRIAAQKLIIAKIKEGSETETEFLKNSLEERRKLEDLNLRLTLASNEKATSNEIALLKFKTEQAKKAINESLDAALYEEKIDEINSKFDKLLTVEETKILENTRENFSQQEDLQEQFAERSIQIEINRLNEIISARKAAGEDVQSQELALAKKQNELLETQSENRLSKIDQEKEQALKKQELEFQQENIKLLESAEKTKITQENLSRVQREQRKQQLEAELALIKEYQGKRRDAETEAAKEDLDLAAKIAQENQDLLIQDAERELEIQEEIATINLAKQNEALSMSLDERKEFFDAANELADAFADREKQRSQERINDIDKEIAAREKQVSKYEELASTQNTNAAESIAFEERRIAELTRQKEKEAAKQRLIEISLAAFKSYTGEIENGSSPSQALASTLKNVTLLATLVRTLPSFDKGSEYLTSNSNVDGKGGFLAINHPGEAILTKEQNRRRLETGMDLDQTIDSSALLMNGLKKPTLNVPLVASTKQHQAETVNNKTLKSIDKNIQKLKVNMGSKVDPVAKTVTDIIKTQNSTKLRTQKIKKW